MRRFVSICSLMSLFGILLLLFSPPASATIQFVQQATANNQNSQNTTLSVTLPNTAAGNLLVAYVTPLPGQVSTISVADNGGNTYTAAASTFVEHSGAPCGNLTEEFFYAANIHGGSITVTAAIDVATGMGLTVLEYSGVATTAPLDAQAGTSDTTCPWNGTPTSASLTTTNANDLIISGATLTATDTWTAGTGYALRTGTSGPSAIEDQAVSSTGTYTGTFTLGTNASAFAAALAFKAAGSSNALLCGLVDDGQVHPPTNYTTFTPPSKGGTYVDPDFGCTVKRVSDAVTDFGSGNKVHHQYATISPFNANDTLITLLVDPGGAPYIADMNGGIVVPRENMVGDGTVQWDATNAYVFWRTAPAPGQTQDTQLLQLTINYSANCASAHNCTLNTPVVWHDFANDGYTAIENFATGGTGISRDGDHIALAGIKCPMPYNAQTCQSAIGTSEGCEFWLNQPQQGQGPCFDYYFVWKLSTKAVDYQPSGSGTAVWHPGVVSMHGFLITANNSILVGLVSPDCDSSSGGSCIWDGTHANLFQRATNHVDFGLDMAGNDVGLVARVDNTVVPGLADACPNGGGSDIQKSWSTSWTTMTDSCWFDTNWRAQHISYRGGPTQPWAIWSAFDDATYGGIYNIPPESDWQTVWPKWAGEVVAARVDANNDPTKVVRLAHHRSHPNYSGDDAPGKFWRQPHAAISRSGKYVMFDSDMGIIGTDGYTDSYIIQIQ